MSTRLAGAQKMDMVPFLDKPPGRSGVPGVHCTSPDTMLTNKGLIESSGQNTAGLGETEQIYRQPAPRQSGSMWGCLSIRSELLRAVIAVNKRHTSCDEQGLLHEHNAEH